MPGRWPRAAGGELEGPEPSLGGVRPISRRSRLSWRSSSRRRRASALVKICAISCRRRTSESGQSRGASWVLKARAPTGASPPTRAAGSGSRGCRTGWRFPGQAASAGNASSVGRTTARPARTSLSTQGTASAGRLGRSQVLMRVVDVGRRDHPGSQGRPLPEDAEVDAEGLADPAHRVLDLAVHFVR